MNQAVEEDGAVESDPSALFHEASRTVRFWIRVEGRLVGASIGSEALHYHYRPEAHGEDPLETYRAHAGEMESAVRRRVAGGSLQPVMLREHDLRSA
jgi:hypothetical protein